MRIAIVWTWPRWTDQALDGTPCARGCAGAARGARSSSSSRRRTAAAPRRRSTTGSRRRAARWASRASTGRSTRWSSSGSSSASTSATGSRGSSPHVEGDEHHHHLVCDDCGKVEPFTDETLERALERAAGRLGYAMEQHEVVLRGACDDCR